MVHISVNQLKTSVIKACVGAKVSRGIAEDIADGCIALAQMGHDPLPGLLSSIKEFDPDTKATEWWIKDDLWRGPDVVALRDGPSMVDLAETTGQSFGIVDNVKLILGLCEARRSKTGALLRFNLNNGDVWSDCHEIDPYLDLSGEKYKLHLKFSEERGIGPAENKHVKMPAEWEWKQLLEMADEILVPADDTNRADAGAGLTDND